MIERFSLAKERSVLPSVELQALWEVKATPAYHTVRQPSNSNYLVAIHTITGQGKIKLFDGSSFLLDSDTLIFLDNNIIQHYRCAADNWDFYWFVFKTSEPQSICLNKLFKIAITTTEPPTVELILTNLHKENIFSRRIAAAGFAQLLYSWLAATVTLAGSLHTEAIEAVIELMHRHLDGSLKIANMAANCGMSARNFRRSFVATTGQSPKAYYDNIRLEAVYNLLQLNIYNIAELAVKLGFSSQFHLSRSFRQKFGIPPSQAKQCY
ncbi:MAG: AraC family transcriptional regulator [Victivallaceae bacterium]|nr:AraC family transcriptional regulator [Victivallaceae bacterium]